MTNKPFLLLFLLLIVLFIVGCATNEPTATPTVLAVLEENTAVPTTTPPSTPTPAKLSQKGQILFVTTIDGYDEIFVMDVDGTNQKRLTNNQFGDGSPVWSPDGQSVLFNSDRDGDSEIFMMIIDGTNVQQLTHNEASDYAPNWSPDGTQIVFVSDRDLGWQESEIYTMSLDGSQQQRITNNKRKVLHPEWFEEKQIRFIQEEDNYGHYQWVVVTADAPFTEQERIAIPNDLRPVQSPDKLTFATTNQIDNIRWENEREIHLVNAELKIIEKFPITIAYPDDLNWTNDGQFIIFSGFPETVDQWRDIFKLDINTGEVIQITFSEQDEFSPNLWP